MGAGVRAGAEAPPQCCLPWLLTFFLGTRLGARRPWPFPAYTATEGRGQGLARLVSATLPSPHHCVVKGAGPCVLGTQPLQPFPACTAADGRGPGLALHSGGQVSRGGGKPPPNLFRRGLNLPTPLNLTRLYAGNSGEVIYDNKMRPMVFTRLIS